MVLGHRSTNVRNRRVAIAPCGFTIMPDIGQYYCRNVKVRTTLIKIFGRYVTTSLSR